MTLVCLIRIKQSDFYYIPYIYIYTKEIENIHPHKILYANIHSSIIHRSSKVETIQMSISC